MLIYYCLFCPLHQALMRFLFIFYFCRWTLLETVFGSSIVDTSLARLSHACVIVDDLQTDSRLLIFGGIFFQK